MYLNNNMVEFLAVIAIIISAYCLIKVSDSPKLKRLRRSQYQVEIDKFFENMRWYGFKDHEIADMLHTHHQDHESLKEANTKAYKERVGKI